jgi:D-serine deaminase-like pyridoxal phosphate-dependent protein
MAQLGLIGQPKEALDTPVLLVDLDIMERNVDRMARIILRQAGVGWRPHTKGMKTPALAHMLLEAGAHGITCAKLGEAEVMACAGVRDILVANQIVGAQKIARLVNLRRHCDIMVLVDHPENVEQIDRAARAKGVQVRVLIEVNVGMDRAGVEAGESTLVLARQIAACEGLRLTGLQTWESHSLKIADPEEKRQVILAALKLLTDTAQLCRDEGLPMDIISCGGTGTYAMSAFAPGITEIEAGGGIYSDRQYRTKFGVEHDDALTILATVTSRPTPTRIICDAGKKTMSNDSTEPKPIGIEGVEELSLSAEHGKIELKAPSTTPQVGDLIEFIAGYSDTTVVLHEEIYGIRSGKIETVWPLWGRGRLQ